MKKNAVVLLNLGGPDSLAAVKPFLRNLFSDHDIFKIPFGQAVFARLISRWRAPKVIEKYKRIGGKSPINQWTSVQGAMLQEAIAKEISGVQVYIAMRYWNPSIQEVAAELSEKNFKKIILLPLYPQYSITTTGSSFKEWERSYPGDPARISYIDHYAENRKYILAINHRIDEAVLRFPSELRKEIQIVFSAHGTPEKLVKQGDPYSRQIKSTVARVMAERNFSHAHHLCFQSKVGPLSWLKPSTVETLMDLADHHHKQILIVPISFVSDHIETLFELDIEYREIALKAGIENYVVMQGLNDSETFIDALKDIAIRALSMDTSKQSNTQTDG